MAEDWAPTTVQVRNLLPQRLVGFADFTADTRPTAAQVAEWIDDVTTEILEHAGGPVPEERHPLATRAAKYGVAAEVEAAIFPEAATRDDSESARLRTKYHELRDELVEAMGGSGGDGTGAGSGSDRPLPRATFPDPWGAESIEDESYYPLGKLRF